MTALDALLVERIKAEGALSVADFMEACLYHPTHGYYMRQDGIGAGLGRNNFTTAPEISQLFGEMLAFYFIDLWQKMGMPTPIKLVELGPGRGTLMLDMLSIFTRLPSLDLEIELIEISPILRNFQQKRLQAAYPNLQFNWHETVTTVEKTAPWFVIANEVYDALPIHQFYQASDSDKPDKIERKINFHPNQGCFYFEPELADVQIIEVCPKADTLTRQLSESLLKTGGAALIIDYGHNHPDPIGDTLQGLYQGQPISPLFKIGEADLTAHVAFNKIIEIADATGLETLPLQTQRDFLLSIGEGKGLQTRLDYLCTLTDSEETANRIKQSALRLIAPTEMGNLFKCLTFYK